MALVLKHIGLIYSFALQRKASFKGCCIAKRCKNMIQLDSEKLRKPLKPAILEVRLRTHKIEIKPFTYISTMSCPHSQLSESHEAAVHTSRCDISPLPPHIFPQGKKNTITLLCHTVEYITFCTFQPEKRGGVLLLGHMAS